MVPNFPLLLFTDLDGTLLDHQSYDWRAAEEALAQVRKRQIPLIINSSKTLAECRETQQQLQLQGPIIFENGAAVAIPVLDWPAPADEFPCDGSDWIKAFATPYVEVRDVLQTLRRDQYFKFIGFGDMTVAEISEATGLPHDGAARAKQRQFSEPIVWRESAERFTDFCNQLQERRLSCARGGRFIHVGGKADKGQAMLWVAKRLGRSGTAVVALGDSDNDIPMLSQADVAVWVRSPAHDLPKVPISRRPPRVLITDEYGPDGWNRAVLTLLEEFANG